MALFKWNDNYSVGIKVFDDDHKKLIEFLNKMFDLLVQNRPKEEIKPVLDGLKSYTNTHFKNEERQFDKYNFPETEVHKEKHRDFINKVNEFHKGFNDGKLMLSMEVMNFLKDWLKTHINGTDKNYTTFLNEKGVF